MAKLVKEVLFMSTYRFDYFYGVSQTTLNTSKAHHAGGAAAVTPDLGAAQSESPDNLFVLVCIFFLSTSAI